ncbi:uncharacterized protein LOC101457532 [Ceratitis capitata]|uniref:uncharacterized protein LOC101457532 n=1 Tax=Ceratitis capitata TaxID=7213 RepID=UPI000329D65B|nr:uncharacterized protein LOC101457532 [Ceratitis capitata]
MGNLYTKVWSNKKKESKMYVKPVSKETVLKAVEDIQNLTPEQVEAQFENVCRESQKELNGLTHNPCGRLSLRIKHCLDENVQQMSKCFAEMDAYKSCVNDMVSKKIARVIGSLDNIDKEVELEGKQSDRELSRKPPRQGEEGRNSCA